jgi:hypothetical protein
MTSPARVGTRPTIAVIFCGDHLDGALEGVCGGLAPMPRN